MVPTTNSILFVDLFHRRPTLLFCVAQVPSKLCGSEQPYNSRFAMGDIPLMLLDIMENDTRHAEFTFLSACHTAVGDEETPVHREKESAARAEGCFHSYWCVGSSCITFACIGPQVGSLSLTCA
ncbi:hypothetical protein DFJ58DRAFT_151441 [Suillus subalutaceus]|uniref:uncharacterized protein n=1 Tax=Suillus subalutaceus TaxID=48586 RepID=UPI001B86DD68|nr:uncharacterized protein DFJ58DRAFT_151441 [Suillus subalutaceus]KAG1865780.1 hypothetical protein DFJ58DRAFT_151441 [Suillus subalutaceus]